MLNPTQFLQKQLAEEKRKKQDLCDQLSLEKVTSEALREECLQQAKKLEKEVEDSTRFERDNEELYENIYNFCSSCALRDESFCTTSCPLYKARIRAERR